MTLASKRYKMPTLAILHVCKFWNTLAEKKGDSLKACTADHNHGNIHGEAGPDLSIKSVLSKYT